MLVSKGSPPKLGPYILIRELCRDAYGICYEGKKEGQESSFWVRALAPEITNNENFIVRFELLRSLLPQVEHKHLRKILMLGQEGKVFFLVKETLGPEARTLAEFDVTETANRYRTLEVLFDGVAQGLMALAQHRDSFFQDGILHDSLAPSQVWITMERSLIGSGLTPVAKVDGFAEPFLYFGDEAHAALRYRLTPSLWGREHEEAETPNLYAQEYLHSSNSRRGLNSGLTDTLYSFGSLVYRTITGKIPKGNYPSILDTDSGLDPIWETLLDGCLSAPNGQGFHKLEQAGSLLRQILNRDSQLSHRERQLKDLEVPPNMALVVFHDKVQLGSARGPANERPSFRARIQPFFMDLYPVTVADFQRFLPSYTPSSLSRSPDQPATLITWHMAQAYCDWRAEQEKLPKGTYRLPTEYEWEAACRGGGQDLYPWGSQADLKRMHSGRGPNDGASSVRARPPGRFGLYDLLGNVWEWTSSTYKAHPFSDHHEVGYDKQLRVVKGGCWLTPKEACRATLRTAHSPNERLPHVGFRCVRLVPLDEHE